MKAVHFRNLALAAAVAVLLGACGKSEAPAGAKAGAG